MITHNYTGSNGSRSGPGPQIWSKVARNHANWLLSLSGHIHSDTIPRQVVKGDHGNIVYELLSDYQNDPYGGNGYFVLLTFYTDGRIEVQAYSPYLGQERPAAIDEFDNHFVIDTTTGQIRSIAQ